MKIIDNVPDIGETRTKSGFLFLPMSIFNIENVYEDVRWLQFATWEETYTCSKISGFYWKTTRFL